MLWHGEKIKRIDHYLIEEGGETDLKEDLKSLRVPDGEEPSLLIRDFPLIFLCKECYLSWLVRVKGHSLDGMPWEKVERCILDAMIRLEYERILRLIHLDVIDLHTIRRTMSSHNLFIWFKSQIGVRRNMAKRVGDEKITYQQWTNFRSDFNVVCIKMLKLMMRCGVELQNGALLQMIVDAYWGEILLWMAERGIAVGGLHVPNHESEIGDLKVAIFRHIYNDLNMDMCQRAVAMMAAPILLSTSEASRRGVFQKEAEEA